MAEPSELTPPRKGAEPGYYPDPLGGKWARWWDGTQWTQNVGPRIEPGAPGDVPLPPPTKVCRRCAAQSQTFASQCPNCGRAYGRLAAWQVIAISLASLLLVIGGCGACAFLGLKAAEEELENHAITRAEFESLRPGASLSEVEAELGDPLQRERRGGGRLCLTYTDGDDLFDATFYELCFRDRKLVSKTADKLI